MSAVLSLTRFAPALSKRLVVGFALLAAAVTPAFADVSDALKAVERDGHVRVIMRMRTGQGSHRAWTASDSAVRQAQAVDAALDDTAGALSAAKVQNFRRFRTLPFVAAEVDKQQLLSLAASADVESISIVQIERKVASSPYETQQLASSVPSIDVPSAWAAGYDGSGLTVAVIDGGFNLTHPMLAGKVVGEACFSHSFGTTVTSRCPVGLAGGAGAGAASNCPSGSTRCDHGTHVASTAVGNDGTNFGVARGAKLLPIDVFSTDTDPADCSPDAAPCEVTDSLAVLDALDYINLHSADLNIAAVNYSSAGSNKDGYCDDDARKPVIDMLRQKGIAVTIAAGNSGLTGKVGSPSCISSAETISASDDGTNVASFSNFATMVDLMAPGVSIRAASGTGSGFLTLDGTSMAAPHVAGAWAIMRQAFPTASFDQIDSTLKQTGLPLTRAGATFSVPKIQVNQAIQLLKGRNRGFLNNVVSVTAPAQGQSFLRFFNTSAVPGTVNMTIREAHTGSILATWASAAIAPGASLQVPMQTIETSAVPVPNPNQSLGAITNYNLDITATFSGYLQHVLWSRTAGIFANLTSCGTGSVPDATLIPNVHSSAIANYASRLRIVNTGVFTTRATLTFSNATTGAAVLRWVSPDIASGGEMDVSVPQLEAQETALQQALSTGLTQYNVKLEGGFSGYLQHVIENQAAGALVDMTAKCALAVVPATAASTSGATVATGSTVATSSTSIASVASSIAKAAIAYLP